MKATRDGYGDALLEIGADKRVVALDADLSESTRSCKFAEKYPERFFDMGIAEQDMVATAAGLAASGKIPFASSFAVFATGRAYGQMRLAAISNLNIRIVGSHAGLLTGEDGATHQALEDISLTRTLANMAVIQPADYNEAKAATKYLLKHKGPAYLRLGRGKLPLLEHNKFQFGKAVTLKKGKKATIFATGALVHTALEAAENLDVNVVNIHTIKPIDEETIIKLAKETKAIVTAEDHSIYGGLGSSVAEILAENGLTNLERIGVKDSFGESGKPAELYQKYGLTKEAITKAVKKVMRMKQ